jgi:uncharacterized membrane protein required for colicin V production
MASVDLFILLVIAGRAAIGMVWGAVRMAAGVAAVAAGVLAARWAGPAAAALLTGGRTPTANGRLAATAAVALAAVLVVWLAGKGLRRGVRALHLGFLDRLAGGVLGAAGAVVVLAVLLGLAAMGGRPPSTPWAGRLAQAGQAWLALQKLSYSSAMPSSTPSTPTSRGQQPQ